MDRWRKDKSRDNFKEIKAILIAILFLGLGFLAVAVRSLAASPTPAAAWARPTFLASIAYLGLSLVVLVIDAGAVR